MKFAGTPPGFSQGPGRKPLASQLASSEQSNLVELRYMLSGVASWIDVLDYSPREFSVYHVADAVVAAFVAASLDIRPWTNSNVHRVKIPRPLPMHQDMQPLLIDKACELVAEALAQQTGKRGIDYDGDPKCRLYSWIRLNAGNLPDLRETMKDAIRDVKETIEQEYQAERAARRSP